MHLYVPIGALTDVSMGFPGAVHSEFAIPWLLVHALILLSYVQRLFLCVFNATGLGDLLDLVSDVLWPETHGHGQQQHVREDHQFPQFRSALAALIKEALPTLRYEELLAAEEEGGRRRVDGGCSVCLHELEAAEEVRRLGNCRHVFHRACIDRWVDHGQVTCPLCRARLVPEEAVRLREDGAFGGREMLAYAAGVPGAYNVDELSDAAFYYPSPLRLQAQLTSERYLLPLC